MTSSSLMDVIVLEHDTDFWRQVIHLSMYFQLTHYYQTMNDQISTNHLIKQQQQQNLDPIKKVSHNFCSMLHPIDKFETLMCMGILEKYNKDFHNHLFSTKKTGLQEQETYKISMESVYVIQSKSYQVSNISHVQFFTTFSRTSVFDSILTLTIYNCKRCLLHYLHYYSLLIFVFPRWSVAKQNAPVCAGAESPAKIAPGKHFSITNERKKVALCHGLFLKKCKW